MSIDKITKQHVLDAVDKIEREGIVLEPSTRFDVVINGKSYPPKRGDAVCQFNCQWH